MTAPAATVSLHTVPVPTLSDLQRLHSDCEKSDAALARAESAVNRAMEDLRNGQMQRDDPRLSSAVAAFNATKDNHAPMADRFWSAFSVADDATVHAYGQWRADMRAQKGRS